MDNKKPGQLKDITIEDIKKLIQDITWEEKHKPKTVIYTGIEGRVSYQKQIVKSVGGTFTEEDRDKFRQELINSGQTIFKL